MSIKSVRLYPISLQVSPEFMITTTLGSHVISKYVIVAIEDSTGAVGWGEATVVPNWSGETQAGALAVIGEILEPLLLGRDPWDVEAILRAMNSRVIGNGFSKAAVEMALLDLAGKLNGLPVCKLIGGDVNPRRIPIKFSIGLRDPEDAAQIAQEKVREGFRAIKVKVGVDLQRDLLRVRLVREAIGPDVKLNIDVNGGWGVKESIRVIPKFCEYDVEYVEQPTPRWDIDALAQVRNSVDVPIMADESVFTVEDAVRLVRLNAADIISVYPGKNGGLLNSRLICAMAETAGIACHIGSNLEWDIATSAMCHLGVAAGNIRVSEFPVDILGPLYYRTRPKHRVRFEGGHVYLPEGPGLGLEIDESEIEELSQTGLAVAGTRGE